MPARSALVFPGQGSQHVGMLDAVPELDALDRLLDAAEALSGLDLRTVAAYGPVDELADTRIAQPLLYLTDWAWGATLLEAGVEPVAVAGHSLGELAALAVAGVFSPEAGLELVVERSKLMRAAAQAHPGTMAAVLGMDGPQVSEAIDRIADVWVANDNAPGQVVISGSEAGVADASARLAETGAKRIVPLAVSGAFHSPIMKPAGDAFADLLIGAEFDRAHVPVYQNSDPTPQSDPDVIRERLIAQITAPVRWTETMRALTLEGPITLVECGPGSVLSGLAKRVENIATFAVELTDLETLVSEVSQHV